MAAIVTTNILGTTVALGLGALRERLALALIANRDYEGQMQSVKKNATVNIAIPAAVATRTVSPDVVPPAVTTVTPTSVPLTLSQWKEAPFAMDDKGFVQVDSGVLPMQASEAVKAVANGIEDYLWTFYAGAYGYAGTAGTTPFATDLSAYTDARKQANRNLMDTEPRYMILDVDAEGNALNLRAFQDASFGGGDGVILNGQIGRKLGATWVMSQRVPSHTAGTASGATTTGAGFAVGTTSIALASAGTGTILVGDVISFANHAQTYAVVTGDADVSGGGTIVITPGLTTALPASAQAITVRQTHVLNSLIHRDALAFAMAPLVDSVVIPGQTTTAVAMDEVSGLALRLEVTRQHRQVQWSFDALYGGVGVRMNAWVRCAG